MEKKKLDWIISILREHNLREDMPTMSMGNGKIAGSVESGDDPPVKKRKKYIYLKGVRKNWKS